MRGKKGSMIRQIYLYMMGEQQRPDWKCLMFNNAARPKAYFTMWLMLNKKLATVDRLAKWGVEVNKTCILCRNAEETIEYLIIQCQFARKIILAEGVYEVWIERNNRIFVKKSKMEESVAKEIAYVTIASAPDSIKNVVNEFKF
ncbi:hypothetical protein R3W88_007747 [Solanum pinnatisectum]|uniref:Reverse transcriptase zinc-binding domain-containing protein n=1 Tax=Solanum pinnatisectum TaxID=50273 RepID=A0AAV9M6Q7_9SOLN|nr:hypothetical protein R3W88_007747 [Solanum pinnatisectum]